MPLEQTVTIVNNSGKIISSTGYGGRRHSHDVSSETGSRRSSRHRRHCHPKPRRDALTETNLQALNEAPSTAAYRAPYAETVPLDVALSRLDVSPAADAVLAPRRRSEPNVAATSRAKDIDMNLAYGNVPPDLADRVDLDPGRAAELDRSRARQLVRRVEGLLDEAHCLQHSATSIIKSLQERPDAAAEVALTLADLSSAVSKMSPAFLGLLKGGSPAVFALLASPHFLIGTGIAVGVTVVMFGGWKIVKKMADAQAQPRALEGAPLRTIQPDHDARHGEQSSGVQGALVVDDELSTIESWRRGIQPSFSESADLELITPEADRATRERHTKDGPDIDARSQRSGRTHKSSKSHRKLPKEKGSTRRSKSSGGDSRRRSPSDRASVSGGSDARGPQSSRGGSQKSVKAIEGGRGGGGSRDDELDVFRPRARHGDNMLKAIFRSKKEKEGGGGGGGASKNELVLA